jgi:cytidyltransferase-like protein
MKRIAVTGSFADLRLEDVRFLEEASKLGRVEVLLWPDALLQGSRSGSLCQALEGRAPKFPLEERQYVLKAIRYVSGVSVIAEPQGGTWPFDPDALPDVAGFQPDTWVVPAGQDTPQKRAWCQANHMAYQVIGAADLKGYPGVQDDALQPNPGRKKVLVTGCYDWLHSGHVRFFEEVSELGDLYVVVGHDENVRLLKGSGHPLFNQEVRRYMVQSIRHVRQALISSGAGWMDAEPEINRLKPEIYAVNEDGDKPEKRTFCAEHGLQYVVLKRSPKAGLPPRQSTDLRGF